MDDSLAGNVFACRWSYDNKTVCWVTQLVVHQDYRERGLATGLLNQLRQYDDDSYGVMSSHPAACLAAAKAFGSKPIFVFVVSLMLNVTGSINTVRLNFIKGHVEEMMKASPIRYVKEAKLAVVYSTMRIPAGLCQVLILTFRSIILNRLKLWDGREIQ